MTRFNGGYIMLDLNSNNIYNEAKDVIGTSKPIMLYPLNNETPYYIKKLALVNKEGVLYVNINDEYLIEPDNVVTPIEPETLPIATASVLGGVKIGSNINVSEDGTISTHGEYTLPTATASVLGGVKIGSGINVAEDGTISVSGGSQHLYLKTILLDMSNSSNTCKVYLDILDTNNDDITTLQQLYDVRGKIVGFSCDSDDGGVGISGNFYPITRVEILSIGVDVYYSEGTSFSDEVFETIAIYSILKTPIF